MGRVGEEIRRSVGEVGADLVFALTDSNVRRLVDAGWEQFDSVLEVPAGEQSKSLSVCSRVWEWLTRNGATRKSLLVNVGGGIVTDLGGFAAATFKRGIRFINVPTTLLAAADAAFGGKTGIDFMGLKNEIGAFARAERVLICPEVLETLPERELRSGFAEVVKTAILTDAAIYEQLLQSDALHNQSIMATAMRYAADAKKRITDADPYESGIRRILNFGHTAGHAYESYAAEIGRPITHGEAVAHGMLRALELSRDRLGFPAEKVEEYREKILERYYSPLPFGEEAGPILRELMTHDKKNETGGEINYILIPEIACYSEIP